MGILENAKEAAEAAAKKVGEVVEEGKEHIADKVDEVKADLDVKKAEANRDAVKAKNDVKEKLRD